ncbi:hypothetical protein [Aristaeella lactis]|uniref:Uncharacterized protein n=1 Tax=Aristaeella lactis TaxID=3046383 RepID=A0AC61PLB0_9FIRM|nr:hypothetical protein [Aristaeella lactis]QUA52175.1 hypothetical protein JYE50_10660 [Aristaeella lactis]SMC58420.1 hypothetical protein SAMN06297397_1553 [Aristaeella lactis]
MKSRQKKELTRKLKLENGQYEAYLFSGDIIRHIDLSDKTGLQELKQKKKKAQVLACYDETSNNTRADFGEVVIKHGVQNIKKRISVEKLLDECKLVKNSDIGKSIRRGQSSKPVIVLVPQRAEKSVEKVKTRLRSADIQPAVISIDSNIKQKKVSQKIKISDVKGYQHSVFSRADYIIGPGVSRQAIGKVVVPKKDDKDEEEQEGQKTKPQLPID